MKKPVCQICGKENHNGKEWCGPCMKMADDYEAQQEVVATLSATGGKP